MEQRYYSVYNAILYRDDEVEDFYAVKNLLNTESKEIDDIEKILYRHGVIQTKDIGLYCFVPGDCAKMSAPNIVCFLDFYLVNIDDLEIAGKVKTYQENATEFNNFLIICEADYAKSHGWME